MAVLERFSEREPDYWRYRAATEAVPRPAVRPQSSPPAPTHDEPALPGAAAPRGRWPAR